MAQNIDELAFAREQLRRAVLKWANETVPEAMKAMEHGPHDEGVDAMMEALCIAHQFPTRQYHEYRDLLLARIDTIVAERSGRE